MEEIAPSLGSASSLSSSSSPSSSPEVAGNSQYTHQQFEGKYGAFLSSDFDPAQYAQRIAADSGSGSGSDGITQLMGTLASRADSLESLLKHTILGSHAALLQQVVGVRAVDAALGRIEDQVRAIKASMHGLRTRVRVPYEQALRCTAQAANLQAATACVRALARLAQLVRRLRAQLPDDPARADFALAALTLADIERLTGGGDALRGVRLADRALADDVAPRRARTLAEAERLVGGGMRRARASDVAAGLQILANLGALPGAVAAAVRRCAVEWAGHVDGALRPHAHAAGAAWAQLEALADDLARRGAELRVLERVLARRRDSVLPRFDVAVGANIAANSTATVHVTADSDVVALLGDRALAFWWGTAVAALAAELDAACAESSVIRQALINGYPRLVQLLVSKLEGILAPRLGGVVSVAAASHASGDLRGACVAPRMPHVLYGDAGPAVLWGRLLAKYEAEYVLRAAARISDAVGRCFPPPPPPGLLDAQEAWASSASSSQRGLGGLGLGGLGGLGGGGGASAEPSSSPEPPSRRLVAGVVRSISTELEMAKSDTRLSAAVARAAAAAVASFIATCDAKLTAMLAAANLPSALRLAESSSSLALPRFCVGLINAAESLRCGVAALCESEYGGSAATASNRLRQLHRDASSNHRRSQSSVSSPSSPRPGSFVASFAASESQACLSAATVVRDILDTCSHDLQALISRQATVLLDAADFAITESIINSGNNHCDSLEDGGDTASSSSDSQVMAVAPFEASMQWLQTQVLEPLETEFCRRPAFAMVDRYLCLYTRVVCLTFPLTEAAKLRLTAEVTQF
ncbi:Conserved oligomeric Golgi complex subunit, partial [Coemansia sp. RSA 25]